jgi:hypothetical protein
VAAAEARAFEETAGELAGSLPPLAPRPQLKAAVMARIATTRQLSPLPEDEEPVAEGAEPGTAQAGAPSVSEPVPSGPAQTGPAASGAAPEGPAPSAAPVPPGPTQPAGPAEPMGPTDPAGPTPPVVPLDRYRASVRRSRWTAVAAAALLLTTIAGFGLWGGERAAQREMRETIAAMQSQQATTQEEREMLSTILAAGDATHVAVPVRDGGSLQLMYSRERGAMLVQPAELPALPADETYQLWMIDGDDVTSAGLLEDPADAVMHAGTIPEGIVVGLTIEPAGGSEQPSMEPLGHGELT